MITEQKWEEQKGHIRALIEFVAGFKDRQEAEAVLTAMLADIMAMDMTKKE